MIEALLEEKLKASVIENIEVIRNYKSKSWFLLKNNINLQTINNDHEGPQNAQKVKDFIKIKEPGIPEEIFDNVYIVKKILKKQSRLKKRVSKFHICNKRWCCLVSGWIYKNR